MTTPVPRTSVWQRSTTRRILLWLTRWSVLRLLVLFLAIVATLPVLLYAIENWRGQRAWNQHRNLLLGSGEKLTLEAVAPPPIPDARNLAMAPIFVPLFNYTQGREGTVFLDTNGLERLRHLSSQRGGRRGQEDPAQGSIYTGSFAQLDQWREFYQGNAEYPQSPPDTSDAQVILTALDKLRADLVEIRQAADRRPESRWPIRYSHPEPADILIPHLAPLKSIGMVLNLRAVALLETGNAAEAFADWQLALRLADSLKNEPLAINHLVRVAMLAGVTQTVREGMVRRAWSEDQLTQIQRELGDIDLLAELLRVIRGERAHGLEIIEWLRRDVQNATRLWGPDGQEEGLESRLLRWMPRGWYYQNMVGLSALHQKFLDTLAESGSLVTASDAAADAFTHLPKRPTTYLVHMLGPQHSSISLRTAQMQSLIDATQVACAIEKYRTAHATLPSTLEALVPGFLRQVPSDVIDRKPLRYRPEPDGSYDLYSVGWNEKDDGATLALSPKNKKHADPRNGDWVWTLPAPGRH